MTQLLQCLRDELVRRDSAAPNRDREIPLSPTLLAAPREYGSDARDKDELTFANELESATNKNSVTL